MKPLQIWKMWMFIAVISSANLGIISDISSQPLRALRRVSLETFHGKCIHVRGSSPADWTQNRQPLWTWDCLNANEFLFSFIPVGYGGWYKIRTFHGKCIHVQGSSPTDWTQDRQALWTWDCLDRDEFLFRLEPVGSNYYRIRTFHGKCIHVQGSNSDDWQRDRQSLWTWNCLDRDEFLFRLVQK